MKFKFKIQQYQSDAVDGTVAVFTGQPSHQGAKYCRELGKTAKFELPLDGEFGYGNHDIELDNATLLKNINAVQYRHDIPLSQALSKSPGRVSLDIEMETGTGKTYVYIKTMFELNKQYGWSKYIIVVPSIAIREGLAKSFQMLEDHFMEHYGMKARWFIYDSKKLQQLDAFSADYGLNVMIINSQAFHRNTDLKEGANNKIYQKRDEFASRRPIDVIAANRPIVIMDEPQKMEGAATQSGIRRFSPLFVLNYSATHRTKHNTIYALDALDAYRQRLVKRIQVKGFEVKNLRGTSNYLYLDKIELSPKRPPMARIEFETKIAPGSIVRKIKTFGVGDSLQQESELAQYEGFTISEIHASGYVTFLNGITIRNGEVIGDTNELAMQRVQIRETIKVHIAKERELYKRGIKCLSLFFVGEVAKYKSYDETGKEVKGVFQKIFEEEYKGVINTELTLYDKEYNDYVCRYSAEEVHRGYFSIDNNNRVKDSFNRKTGLSDDISAYDLILRNKERLLSFEEPTRFIFSHSALREGWDNPNVFQICMLRHSDSTIARRQEVGRGLRLCVDKHGIRMDAEQLGDDVHEVNKLTVIANESYGAFTKALQRETREALRDRAVKASISYFTGKHIKVGQEIHTITEQEAIRIYAYLLDSGYIDADDNITSAYRVAADAGAVEPLPKLLQPMAEGVNKLINAIFDPKALDGMGEEVKPTTSGNALNANFDKAEFKTLWNEINHKYVYTVSYDSNELIEKVISKINTDLEVKQLRYIMVEGTQDEDNVGEFGNTKLSDDKLTSVCTSSVRYDLVGDIAKGAKLTRRSVVRILKCINESKFNLFKNNPEDFIRNVVRIIKEQKSAMIVEHIHYNMTEGKYDCDIFTVKGKMNFDRAYDAVKHVTDYVSWDSKVELNFAKALDEANDVIVYAKLPRSFQIPTPVGNYAPDWAIALNREGVRHLFFIAETKGTMSSMALSDIEKVKIKCAHKLFDSISTANVRYREVSSYQELLDCIHSLS